MTTPAGLSYDNYPTNGVSLVFPFTFKYENAGQVRARLVDPNTGNLIAQLTQGVDFSVAPAGPANGGSITTLLAYPAGTVMQIFRQTEIDQQVNFVNFDDFPAGVVNSALDKLTEICQELRDLGAGFTQASSGITGGTNVGVGLGTFYGALGGVLQFKSLFPGVGITVSDNGAGVLTISALGLTGALLVSNNLSDVASRQTALNFLAASTSAGNVLTYNGSNWVGAPPATGASGEANTMSSLGGTSLVGTKSGVDLPIKGLTAGANITITPSGSSLSIAATGEANVGGNVGVTGQGLYVSKIGTTLNFKGIAAGLGVSVTANATDLTLAINTAAALTWPGQQKFNGAYADVTVNAQWAVPGFNQYATRITRTSPAGGAGTVQSAEAILVLVAAGVKSFEWAQTIILDDAHTSSDGGQNVGQYIKAYKRSTGQVWGQVIEVQDTSGNTNSTIFGIELDLAHNGNVAGFRRGISMFYGDTTLSGTASGVTTLWDIGMEMYPTTLGKSTMGQGINLGGTFLQAVINMTTLQATPVAIDMAGGAALKFRSGSQVGVASPTWYPGAFAPTFVGALRIFVDGSTLYVPVCSNHP